MALIIRPIPKERFSVVETPVINTSSSSGYLSVLYATPNVRKDYGRPRRTPHWTALSHTAKPTE